jgi:hypothetical protein
MKILTYGILFDLSRQVFSKYTIFIDQSCTLINVNEIKQIIYFGMEGLYKIEE